MEKWEYRTETLSANVELEGVKDYLAMKYPELKPAKFSVQSLQLQLDNLGEIGWELIHMQPIAKSGNNGDVYFNGDQNLWSHDYFCVFKRRKEE